MDAAVPGAAAGSSTPAPENLAAWRARMRTELIARRSATAPEERRAWNLSISLQLLRSMPWLEGWTIGFCWPYKGEYDARPLLRSLRARHMRCALPVVVRKSEAMIFRHWQPGVAMGKGALGIAYPTATEQVDPDVLLIPVVGFGRAGDRLGYGGGYFDRTLAALDPRPLCIGVGYELCRIETSFPQPHDVLMDAIVTETTLRRPEAGVLRQTTALELRAHLGDVLQERRQLARINAHTVPRAF